MDLARDIATTILPAGIVTMQITIGAWIVSAVGGLLLALLRQAGGPIVRLPLTGFIAIFRSLPQLVILYAVFFGTGSFHISLTSLIAAIIGLGLSDAVYSAEYYRAGFITVPNTQQEAGLSLGLSRLAIMRHIVLPQALPFLVPPLMNSFVGMMKAATLAAAIGAPEILYAGQLYMEKTGMVAIVAFVIIVLYMIATIPLTRFIARMESRLRASYVRGR